MSEIQHDWVIKVCGNEKGIVFNWQGMQFWLGLHDRYGIWCLLEIQNGFPVRGVDIKGYGYDSEDHRYASLCVSDGITIKDVFQTFEQEDLTVIDSTALHFFWMYLYGNLENMEFRFEGKWYRLEYEGVHLIDKEEWEDPDTSFSLYPPDSQECTYFESVEELLNSNILSPSKTIQQILLEVEFYQFT